MSEKKRKNGEEEVDNTEEQTAQTAEEAEEPAKEDPAAKELEELKDKYMRLAAEYDNFRKRTAKEKENTYGDAYASAVNNFLPVYDNLERAAAESCGDEAYKKGVELILKQLGDIFEKLEIKEVPGVGEPFSPDYHHAVMHIEDESLGENTVAEVFQKGFTYKDRVLRFAMVKVAN